MNNSTMRTGIIVLDNEDMKEIGTRVVGGLDFAESVEVGVGILGMMAISMSAFCNCMNPEQRRQWWATFISNFSRKETGAAAASAAQLSSSAISQSYFSAISLTAADVSEAPVTAAGTILDFAGQLWNPAGSDSDSECPSNAV